MLRLMIQKLLHKRWLVICLLIGNILLVSIAASYPMYRESSLQKMVTTEFNNYMENNSYYPAYIVLQHTMDSENQESSFWNMSKRSETICDEIGLEKQDMKTIYKSADVVATPQMVRDNNDTNKTVNMISMSDFKKHTKILSGTEFSDTIGENGHIDAVITLQTATNLGLLVGDQFVAENMIGKDGNPVKFRITGIFTIADEKDHYWNQAPDDYKNSFMISDKVFNDQFLYDKKFHINVEGYWNVNFDYTQITPRQVDSIMKNTESVLTGSQKKYNAIPKPIYMDILESYSSKIERIEATLIILIIPLFILLCAFIYMIASQMLSLEENEISLFKSRGASKKQIFKLYLLQSVFLSLGSLIVGLPLAGLLCRILGSANAFLEFVNRTNLNIVYSKEVLFYGLIAVGASVLITILPVIKSSSISIVNLKQKKARKQKPFWQKFYLDIVLLGISIYGYYSFGRQKQDLLFRVVTGKSIDPLLFLSSSLFILGAGLFALRLQPYFVRLIYRIGKKKWKPANYASFLQIIRTGSKQYFIMVFMILTISLGIFNSTVARTIVLNAQNNTEYYNGTDLVCMENWHSNIDRLLLGLDTTFMWKEPDYSKYSQFDEITSTAKVYRNTLVKYTTGTGGDTEVMGIHTKEFGETAVLPKGLNKHKFSEYLNVLSTSNSACLLSSNYAAKKNIKVGDTITFTNQDNKYGVNSDGDAAGNCTVYGFFDYWPGYKSSGVKMYEDGTCGIEDNYMIVCNLNYIQSQWKVEPYEVWMKTKSDNTDFFYDYMDKGDIEVKELKDKGRLVSSINKDPLFQGTNGTLTMSFIIILILCGIGYLIYWILSIRSRELLFGVFRAMGMSKKEIIHMLVNEQLFTGGLAILLGAGIGVLASHMFVPMLQIAYTGENQALPLELLTKTSDMVRLFVIVAIVFVACMAVLAGLIYKLKIAQALKLGED